MARADPMAEGVRQAMQALRRQRVRQGDVVPALDAVIAHGIELGRSCDKGPVHDAAARMRARARDLKRIARSVPKFAVEDLIEESIAELEAAYRECLRGAPDEKR